MRNIVFVGWVMLVAIRGVAAEPRPAWKLPEAESQKWLARVRALVIQRGWTVAAQGNEITVTRDKPVAMELYVPNARSAEASAEPAGELTLQLVLRFGPKMSTDEFERLAAVNIASERKQRELRQAAGVPYKFDDLAATTPEEKARVQAYRDAVAKLPRHVLPDFYTPEYSIYYVHRWDFWLSPADESVAAEWRRIEEQLIRCFGMYDPLAVANRTVVGQYLNEVPR